MIEAWFLYVIGAVVIWGLNAIIDKIVLTKHLSSFSYFVAFAPPKLLVVIFSLLFFPTNFNSLPFYIAFVAGVLVVLAYYAYAYAMKREEASRIYLLSNIYPAITAILAAIFLKEIFPFNSYFGIALIILGSILISYKKSGVKKMIPILVVLMALSTNFFYGVEQTMSKISLNSLQFWQFFGGYFIGNLSTIIPCFAIPSLRRNFVKEMKKLKINTVLLVEFSATIWLLGIILFMFAVTMAPITLVSSISVINPFFVLFFVLILTRFWPRILKEEATLGAISIKIIATILIFVGTYLIVT